MLFDMIQNYDNEKKQFLVSLREKILHQLEKEYDSKKILSFLGKCWIIWIEEKDQLIHIGVPNEFVTTQVKKFFWKGINDAIQEIYHPHFKHKIHIYTPFQTGNHPLQINLSKTLHIETLPTKKIDSETKITLTDHFGILFDPKFQFNNFIVGGNNTFAFSGAKAIAEKPGQIYNPFFIYGHVGLGKTHLMQAIGNYSIENHPKKVVAYLPTSKLIDEVIESIKKNKMTSFLKKFDDVDILILDDIQFLAEKDKTQEIFHNLFNDFVSKKKQIIMSADCSPRDLGNIEARLKTRFASGLVADIGNPDFETRLAILQSKCKEKGESIERPLLEIIAKHIKDNVRELEGVLNVLITKKKLTGQDIGDEDITNALKTMGIRFESSQNNHAILEQSNQRSANNFGKVVEAVASFYNISINDLKGENRKKEVSLARQMLMMIAKKDFNRTLEKIWDYFGWKNHATVIYAINTFEKQCKKDETLRRDLNLITSQTQ